MLDRIASALSRATTSGTIIKEIDGLRFLAISSVVLYHLLGYILEKAPGYTDERTTTFIGSLLGRGWFGVNLFFVISGFVIGLPFVKWRTLGAEPVSLKKYFLRRLTRLEPPYFICITLSLVLLVIVKGQSLADLLPHYFATLTYTHNLVYGGRSIVNAVAWSLEIEIQFYILAPLLAHVFLLRHRRLVLCAMIVAACMLQSATEQMPMSILWFSQFFLCGFLLADLYTSWQPRKSTSFDAIAIASILGLYLLTGEHDRVYFDPLWVLACCVCLVALCICAFKGRATSAILSNRWLVVIGGMCYTIYLYHEYILSLIGRVAIHASTGILTLDIAIQVALMVLPMLAVASVFFLLFEKPFMIMRSRRSPSPQPALSR